MLRKTRPIIALLLGVVLLRSASAQPAQPERLPLAGADLRKALQSDWYGIYLNGKKIGYFHTSRTKVGQGASAGYREAFSGVLKLASFGQKAEVVLKQWLEFDAAAPYALRGGESLQSDGNTTKKITLSRTAKGLEYVFTAGKEEQRKLLPRLDYTLADAMTAELWLRGGRKVGDKIAFRDFDLERGRVDITKARILSEKTSLVGGVKVRYFDVETVSERDGIVLHSVYDQSGRMLSGNLAGIFEMRLETEEQAKNTEYSQDLFVLGMVKIDRPLGDPVKVRSLVLEVMGKEAALLEDGPRQTIAPKATGVFTVKLGKANGKPTKATADEIKENLKETEAYPINHPKVKALARRAIKDAKTPEEKLRRLVRFVHDFIEPNLTVHLPEIHDLMARKKGDCKCYALLFTTLARAAGLPAREVSGLMYIGDDQKAFGGHAWNEVVLDGHWVPIDASLAETEVNATHISFGTDHRAANAVLNSLGRLRFKLIEVSVGK